MINKEFFCGMMRRGDREFSRLCRITQMLEEAFKGPNNKFLNTFPLLNPLNMMYEALSTALSAPDGLVKFASGLEDPDDTDMTELEEELPDGTKIMIHTYGELYDYLIARRTQLETANW